MEQASYVFSSCALSVVDGSSFGKYPNPWSFNEFPTYRDRDRGRGRGRGRGRDVTGVDIDILESHHNHQTVVMCSGNRNWR